MTFHEPKVSTKLSRTSADQVPGANRKNSLSRLLQCGIRKRIHAWNIQENFRSWNSPYINRGIGRRYGEFADAIS